MRPVNADTRATRQPGVRMADVSDKEPTARSATAQAVVYLRPETLALIREGKLPKGDVVSIARTAAIMAAKRTPELIPLCHPISISHVDIDIDMPDDNRVLIQTTVKATDRTGVEMEALTSACVAALTFYDMCKPVDKEIVISDILLLEKTGGKAGDYKINSKLAQRQKYCRRQKFEHGSNPAGLERQSGVKGRRPQ